MPNYIIIKCTRRTDERQVQNSVKYTLYNVGTMSSVKENISALTKDLLLSFTYN